MSYAERNTKLTDLALKYGEASRELGFANGVIAPGEVFAEAVAKERFAWQAFSDALWGKDSPQPTQTSQGVKSTPADDPYRHPKIGTAPTFTGEPELPEPPTLDIPPIHPVPHGKGKLP